MVICKDCKWLNSFETYYDGSPMCSIHHCGHPDCFKDVFNPLMGMREKRITDYETKNRTGDCPDFERFEMELTREEKKMKRREKKQKC